MASGLNPWSKLRYKISIMKKDKKNSEKAKGRKPEEGSENKKMSSATSFSENAGNDSVYSSFQPTLHRKPFEDKSRMPLSSEEYEDDDFEIDGE
jgi:hypothetical protein